MKQITFSRDTNLHFLSNSLHLVALVLFFTVTFSLVKAANAQPSDVQRTVSFLANVDAGQLQSVFTVVQGTQQMTSAELNNYIRPDGGYVLRIRSIHAYLLRGVPQPGDYAAFFLGACSDEFYTRGFGAGSLAVGGTRSEQVIFQPGIVASLSVSESLCLRSLIQSNYTARVEVHGILLPLKQ